MSGGGTSDSDVTSSCSDNSEETACVMPCVWNDVTGCQGNRRRRLTGAETMKCSSCPKGYYGGKHQRRCVLCPSGYFSGRAKKNACTKCDQGSCLFTLGSTSQTDIKQTDDILININAKKYDIKKAARDPEVREYFYPMLMTTDIILLLDRTFCSAIVDTFLFFKLLFVYFHCSEPLTVFISKDVKKTLIRNQQLFVQEYLLNRRNMHCMVLAWHL